MSACVCIRVECAHVCSGQIINPNVHHGLVIPCVTTRWSHCLVLLTESDKRRDKDLCVFMMWVCFFQNRNYFIRNSTHVIWLMMDFHSLTAHTFTFDICESRPGFLTPAARLDPDLCH